VIGLFIGLTVYGLLMLGCGLFLAIRAEPIRARILRNSSGGVAALIRAIGVLVTILAASLAFIGVGNLIVQV